MKKIGRILLFAVGTFCLSTAPASEATPVNEIKEYISILKEKFQDNPKPTATLNELKELKYPGEKYAHFFSTSISGWGRVKTVWKYWFDTQKTVFIKHESNLVLGETIISTEDEINQGILKSRYVVQEFDEKLCFASGKTEVGYIDSADVLKIIQMLAEAKGTSLGKLSTKMMEAAIAALCVPEGTISKPLAIGLAAGGGLIKIVDIGIDNCVKNINDDGNYKLSEATVRENFPGYEDVIVRLRNLEGTVIESEWRIGEGYTSVVITPRKDKKNEISEDDLEYLARLIYRTNPVNSEKLFPSSCERVNSKWTINAEEIANMVMTPGIEFDSVSGEIYVRNRGAKDVKCDSERAEGTTRMTEIGTVGNRTSRIKLVSSLKNSQDTVVTFIPQVKLLVISDKDAEGKPLPKYLYRAELTGKLESEVKKPGGLFSKVSFDQVGCEIKMTYEQERSVQK